MFPIKTTISQGFHTLSTGFPIFPGFSHVFPWSYHGFGEIYHNFTRIYNGFTWIYVGFTGIYRGFTGAYHGFPVIYHAWLITVDFSPIPYIMNIFFTSDRLNILFFNFWKLYLGFTIIGFYYCSTGIYHRWWITSRPLLRKWMVWTWAPQRLPNWCSKTRRGAAYIHSWNGRKKSSGKRRIHALVPKSFEHLCLHGARSGNTLQLNREQTSISATSLASRRQMCGARPQRWQNIVRNLGMFGCPLFLNRNSGAASARCKAFLQSEYRYHQNSWFHA